ncbi:MAG: sn-glycerol-3-phosphate ABC transporter ATP-binding protein UgpC [Ignavibacteriales bacterium]|nr:sn-glycerol-3-phosphate ABC transporter ATP-binding protein UgpC [Ignavibacteriales bacterium]
MATVRLEHVEKVYEGGHIGVHDMTLDIMDHELIVLVGPSGCGKSTTLRMIAGLEEASSGSIMIDGRVVNDVPPKDRDIAMVFQNYALYPHLTVYENMAFGLRLRKLPKPEIDRMVKTTAEMLGIESLLDRKPKALSGGQRQRVALGRAIVRKPNVFLFDEPLSNLDTQLRVLMRTEISKLHQRLTTTMIYVTHDQTEAMTMGDRIVVMKDGYVLQVDTPLELYHHPRNKFVAGFIGSPAMNFLEGTFHKSGGLEFRDGGGIVLGVPAKHARRLVPHRAKDVILGIRPEDISIGTSRGKAKVRATVEVVEPMGNELYLYFTTREKGAQHVARVDASAKVRVGMVVDLVFDMTKAHFFDRTTEQAL